MSQSPLKHSKEEIFMVNDNAKSDEDYVEDKEVSNPSEDHEVYEPEEESEDQFDREEEQKNIEKNNEDSYEENYVQQDGLQDILEASNENSEIMGGKDFGDDEVNEVEEEIEEKDDNLHLKEKYKEAVQREKELRNIIDVKVQQCEKALGKGTYQEIITFFRIKLNVFIFFKYFFKFF